MSLNCPRCAAQMEPINNHNIAVDVCTESCGGVWFDWMEFKKLDETHEADPEFLDRLANIYIKPIVNHKERVDCPKCSGQKMMRRCSSVKKQVEVDECPKCGGLWLDAGELAQIHSEFETEADRRKAADVMFKDMFGAKLESLEAEAKDKKEKAEKIAKALKFICPSYYIKGKQDWGAF